MERICEEEGKKKEGVHLVVVSKIITGRREVKMTLDTHILFRFDHRGGLIPLLSVHSFSCKDAKKQTQATIDQQEWFFWCGQATKWKVPSGDHDQ